MSIDSGAQIPYATPQRPTTNLWAATVLALVGLGLIVFGGCFLIGVLILHAPQFVLPGATIAWTPMVGFLAVVLYALAAVCLAGGFFVLGNTVRRLLSVIGG